MKKLMFRGISAVLFLLIVTACASDDESGSEYNADDYDFTLLNSAGEEVDIFTDEKALYLYFTGVT
ncbi:hypothetical protein CR203_13815 [Salipaludibacillus neizhouensis]|uniref:Alkyl hydroperoxide reductase subunit C/ Thiol specific antioxidant domain-containing protein n=1 Tax=Salipaludibacillus neizhouensis TaxID=885475 RepID=A0A3A9K936_9BACI|nr:hypothetical protein [Salipaludibacillus neizhouensis]RKL66901.1 hypothetical protein CR203_13815 [Salipaludibacillus neizhouensis]